MKKETKDNVKVTLAALCVPALLLAVLIIGELIGSFGGAMIVSAIGILLMIPPLVYVLDRTHKNAPRVFYVTYDGENDYDIWTVRPRLEVTLHTTEGSYVSYWDRWKPDMEDCSEGWFEFEWVKDESDTGGYDVRDSVSKRLFFGDVTLENSPRMMVFR